jgi:hypothetical protein
LGADVPGAPLGDAPAVSPFCSWSGSAKANVAHEPPINRPDAKTQAAAAIFVREATSSPPLMASSFGIF